MPIPKSLSVVSAHVNGVDFNSKYVPESYLYRSDFTAGADSWVIGAGATSLSSISAVLTATGTATGGNQVLATRSVTGLTSGGRYRIRLMLRATGSGGYVNATASVGSGVSTTNSSNMVVSDPVYASVEREFFASTTSTTLSLMKQGTTAGGWTVEVLAVELYRLPYVEPVWGVNAGQYVTSATPGSTTFIPNFFYDNAEATAWTAEQHGGTPTSVYQTVTPYNVVSWNGSAYAVVQQTHPRIFSDFSSSSYFYSFDWTNAHGTLRRVVGGLEIGRKYDFTVRTYLTSFGTGDYINMGVTGYEGHTSIQNASGSAGNDPTFFNTFSFVATSTEHEIWIENYYTFVEYVSITVAQADQIDLDITEADISLDDSHSPYASLRITAKLPSGVDTELIDPRDAQIVSVGATQHWEEEFKEDQSRVFLFNLAERSINHTDQTITITGYGKEMELINGGRIENTSTTLPTLSVRTATEMVLDYIGETLEPGTADYTLQTDHTDIVYTNLATNPSGETATTGYVSFAGTTGVAAITNPVEATATAGTHVIRNTWSTANTVSGGSVYYDIPVTAGQVYSASWAHIAANVQKNLRCTLEWRTASTSLSVVTNAGQTYQPTVGSFVYNYAFAPAAFDGWTGTGLSIATSGSNYFLGFNRGSGTTTLTASRVITGLTIGNPYRFIVPLNSWVGTGGSVAVAVTGRARSANYVPSVSTQAMSVDFVASATSHTFTITGTNAVSGAWGFLVDYIQVANLSRNNSLDGSDPLSFTNQTAPATATVMRLAVTAYNETMQLGSAIDVDGLLAVRSATLPAYFDGATTDVAPYDYAWTGTANASTSTKSQNISDATTINPGDSYWNLLDPMNQAGGLRLFADEMGLWRLVEANYTVPGVVTVAAGSNATQGDDTISLTSTVGDGIPVWASGVVVRYQWDEAGVTQTAYDVAGTNTNVYRVDINRPYPGPGAAAVYLKRYTGRGRVQELTALSDLTATPGMQLTATMPDTPIQTGIVSEVIWHWSAEGTAHGLMDIRSRGLTDTPETAWVLQPEGYAWDDVPVGMDWTEYVTP